MQWFYTSGTKNQVARKNHGHPLAGATARRRRLILLQTTKSVGLEIPEVVPAPQKQSRTGKQLNKHQQLATNKPVIIEDAYVPEVHTESDELVAIPISEVSIGNEGNATGNKVYAGNSTESEMISPRVRNRDSKNPVLEEELEDLDLPIPTLKHSTFDENENYPDTPEVSPEADFSNLEYWTAADLNQFIATKDDIKPSKDENSVAQPPNPPEIQHPTKQKIERTADENTSDLEREIRTLSQSHLLGEIREILASRNPIRWIFAGDDVVGGSNKLGEDPGFVDMFQERIRWELRRFPDVVVNAGSPHFTISQFRSHLEKHVISFKPNLVVLMPGRRESVKGRINCHSFREDLRQCALKLRQADALVLLMTPPPFFDNPDFSNQDLDKAGKAGRKDKHTDLVYFVDVIREISLEHEFPLIDHYDDWVQNNLQLRNNYFEVPSQKLSGEGQRIIASLMLHELDLYDAQSNICRFAYSAMPVDIP